MDRARNLTDGLPLASFAGKSAIAREVDVLVHRLARNGLLEYRLSFPRDEQVLVVIEPQVPEYWPQRAKLGESDTVVLSRFADLRRRGNEMVSKSPRAGALFELAIPPLPPPSLRCRGLRRSAGFAATRPPSVSICSNCCWIASSCSSSMRKAATAFGWMKATAISFSGMSMISCFTRGAPRADMPIRSAAPSPMQRRFTAACGASAVARQEDRPTEIACFGSDLALRKAVARTPFSPGFR